MYNTDLSHFNIEAGRLKKRVMIMSNLPSIIVLYSKDEGKTYGYKVIKETRRKFKVLVGPSDVYRLLSDLEEQKILKSIDAVFNGRPRKEYYPIEPKVSQYLKSYFEEKDRFDLEIDNMRRRIEENDSGTQVRVPKIMTGINK